ncbi:DUF6879 family protein [Nonomuraea terrae]|uniref:DUF6879 family protein n=1 Tax=Nonomuraea terrae TaxID=2530383 RepID=UPI0037996236
MLERIHEISAVLLSADEYLGDFWPNFRKIDGVFWRLERVQGFHESRIARRESDWDRSAKLVDGVRPVRPFPCRRIRVVEQPVTPYLQWEMHVLALRRTTAEQVRVLDAAEVLDLEGSRRLPELVVLGTTVMYEVTYDSGGAHSGARRIDDPEVIDACCGELDKLFAVGEDLRAYYEREIVPLPAPRTLV